MARIPIILLAALLPLVCLPQTEDRKEIPPPAPPVSNLQGGWDNNLANSQAAQWRDANTNAPPNALMQLNWFRSEQNAMIGNNNGELKPTDKAQLNRIAEDIKTTAPGSFEQHLADYYLGFPSKAAFADLDAANKLAPERAELLAPMLSKAMLDGDGAELRKWSAEMDRRGGVTPPLKAAAADVLLSVPDNGILFTNGDMDTQPAVVRQVQQQEKPDLLIVDRRLLADPSYRERTWRQAGATGPTPSDGPVFAKKLLLSTSRPVYFALSLDRSWLDAFPGHLHAVGAAFRVGAPDAEDAAALARHWAAMKKPVNAGPMSRNYLLPGAILLRQFRGRNDEANASRLEHELRQIAAATGATQDLYSLGILQH
jgi:hypothetical protein